MTISHMLQSLLLKGEGILCKITAMMVAGLNKGCTDEFFDSKWHRVLKKSSVRRLSLSASYTEARDIQLIYAGAT